MKIEVIGFAMVVWSGVLQGQTTLWPSGCSNRDFSGIYGLVASGSVTAPGFPLAGPFARSGQFLPDGDGNVNAVTFASYDGTMFSETISGTYTVSSDCSIVFNIQPFPPIGEPAVFTGLLSADKTEVTFLISSPLYQTIHAVLRKQFPPGYAFHRQGCSKRDFFGPYALLLTGSIVTPAEGQVNQPGEFVRSGKFTPDGNGNFSAETIANYNGFVIQPENFSGTYTVTTGCALSIQYTDTSGVAYTWNGSLTNNARGADVVVFVPSGSAIQGTLVQQFSLFVN